MHSTVLRFLWCKRHGLVAGKRFLKFENQSRGAEFRLNRHFLTENNFIDMVQVHIKKVFFAVNAMILFEGVAFSFRGGLCDRTVRTFLKPPLRFLIPFHPSEFDPSHKLQKPSKDAGVFQSLGTICSFLRKGKLKRGEAMPQCLPP